MNQEENKAKIYYFSVPDGAKKEEKLNFLKDTQFQNIPFERIRPDAKGNWLNEGIQEDWESLIPLCDKDVKNNKSGNAIFKLFSFGVSTNRDEWVYDFDKINLENKMKFFIETFNTNPLNHSIGEVPPNPLNRGNLEDLVSSQDIIMQSKNKKDIQNNKKLDNSELPLLRGLGGTWNTTIKWSEALKNILNRKQKIVFNKNLIISSIYRPFIKQYYYSEKLLSDRLTQNHYEMFGRELDLDNKVIFHTMNSPLRPFSSFCSKVLGDLHFIDGSSGTNCLPLYVYENPCPTDIPLKGEQESGNFQSTPSKGSLEERGFKQSGIKENITDWVLKLFRDNYKDEKINKENIFHYVYAVLHNPAYKAKYEQNLKRDFPRIPFYDDFWKWTEAGKQLMELHLNYEQAPPFKLERIEKPETPTVKGAGGYKAKLKANKSTGELIIDEKTTLTGIPKTAWEYKLGNRSALEWILDQYKESKSRDGTIEEKFNTYKFTDYKEKVIELLNKVCTVSVESMKITDNL